jgi:hypothetical protein
MSRTTGLLIAYLKCNQPKLEAEWETWLDDTHLPDLVGSRGGPWVATRWQLAQKPTPGMPGLGFSHVTIYEFAGPDFRVQVQRFAERELALRRAGRVHAAHAVMHAHAFVGHGAYCDKAEPSDALRHHLIAYVQCNDPDREREWTEWYDREHVPDMLASGAFSAATRWERAPREAHTSNFVTLYDIASEDVQVAVEKSAAVMPGIVAAGRKHSTHTGGLVVTLNPSGRFGGRGFRG